MQKEERILPYLMNLDTAYEKLSPQECPYIKGLSINIDSNPAIGIGANNPSGEGQNASVLNPVRSNQIIPNVLLPQGAYNKCIGSFESVTTQEVYHFNFNANGNHGIYVLDGNTGTWSKVIEDSNLGFSIRRRDFIADHRVTLRVTYNIDGSIKEKYLIITDGNTWHKFINVIAAQKTNGFDPVNPYWSLKPPHFDRRELLELAVRPPMIRPEFKLLPNQLSDTGKTNFMADKAFQIAYAFINTDGRPTTPSPYSLPIIVSTTDYLNNPQTLPRKAQLTFYAGSPLTEKLVIYVRHATVEDGKGSTVAAEWSDWLQYDVINKFDSSGANDPSVIGANYWKRTNPWSGLSYDPVFNTIQYTFDNTKQASIVDQATVNRIQNDLPLRSMAQSDLGDSIIESNNEYDYDNFSTTVLNSLLPAYQEKQSNACTTPARKIRLYAYVGRGDGDNNFSFTSQVGFYFGADKQIRFGGLSVGATGTQAKVDVDETKSFGLDFADKNAFRCYLKGTQYFSDGTWYQVKSDNTMTKIVNPLDFSNPDTMTFVQNVFVAGGYFVCVFDFVVPAGRYVAAIGRHNVSSSGNYKGTSTYVMGIANSRNRTQHTIMFFGIATNHINVIKPNAIVTQEKEMEIDCTNSDVDVWGNGSDIFYIYCPYITHRGNNKFRFIEGYIYESQNNPIAVENFPYNLNHGATDTSGQLTDKNGFYFAHTKAANSDIVDIEMRPFMNCGIQNVFTISTADTGSGWKQNPAAYVSDHNNGSFGDCNRVLYNGKILALDGITPYSNIAVSIVGGETVFTKSDGSFQLVIHNGTQNKRINNIYVNSSGNFQITIANCGVIPINQYNENNIGCSNCNVRVYPFTLNLLLNIVSFSDTSLKEGGKYSVAVWGADLAGRLMYANVLKEVYIPTFLERNDLLPTYLQVAVQNALQLNQNYPDIKWLSFGVSKNLSIKRYDQWVGDSIQYIDNAGNVVSDPASAVYCSISIQSLYNFNVGHNFSTLAKYQFLKGDRLRILDDGVNLLNIGQYGEAIDVQILGTNYNQAAINAGLLPPETNVVLNNSVAQNNQNTSVTLFVRYDSRMDKIIQKQGFWIELYNPAQSSDIYPFNEATSFYPVINGEIAKFTGYNNGIPQYDYPQIIQLDYWDTYLIQRNVAIPGLGDKYFNHPFESPNVNDSFGANLASGGRLWIKNEYAKRQWYKADVIKSDVFVSNGIINGIGSFRSTNRKDYSNYPWGGIVAAHSERSIVFFLCENDWFTTDYNFHYTYANERGVMVTNLNDGLSSPHQKITGKYGCAHVHVGTVVFDDGFVSWYDMANAGFIISDYRTAEDVSDIREKRGEDELQVGIKSYLSAKSAYVNGWNQSSDLSNLFDVVSGYDSLHKNLYLTFRKRKGNTNKPTSYVNMRRNIDTTASETFVFNLQFKRWVRCAEFTPECYGRIRGNQLGNEFITYAAGVPYTHNLNTLKNSYGVFYGVQTEPVLLCVFNSKQSYVKVLQNIILDANTVSPVLLFIDMIYSDENFSFSYIPSVQFKSKRNQFFSSVLRNMVSYPPLEDQVWRSMLLDGKRVFGSFFVVRFIPDASALGQYFELKNIFFGYAYIEGEGEGRTKT